MRERTNCRRCRSFSFFSFHKNDIGLVWSGQEGNVPLPTTRFYRQQCNPTQRAWYQCGASGQEGIYADFVLGRKEAIGWRLPS